MEVKEVQSAALKYQYFDQRDYDNTVIPNREDSTIL